MTTGPRLRLGKALLPGVLAVALFGAMALIVLNTGFGDMQGFPDGISITSEIGYALLDLTTMQSAAGAIGDTEQFLVAFILAAIVLDAALDASLVLAKREEEGEPVTALSSAPSARSSGAGGERPAAAADGGTDRGRDRPDAATADGEDGGEDA